MQDLHAAPPPSGVWYNMVHCPRNDGKKKLDGLKEKLFTTFHLHGQSFKWNRYAYITVYILCEKYMVQSMLTTPFGDVAHRERCSICTFFD